MILQKKVLLKGCLVLILGLALAGCATMNRETAQEMETQLEASGFKMQRADTAEKMDHLLTLPQHKISKHKKDNAVYYTYADATYCKCLYMGDEAAYQEYLDISRAPSQDYVHEKSPMNWDTWDDWASGF